MKNLNITYEDEDFQKLKEARNRFPKCKSWEEFILMIAGVKGVEEVYGEQ